MPAIAGINAIARDVHGDVFVKLPGRSSFAPLKGVASLPIGATVDARKGSVALISAANARRASDRRRRTAQARLAAGIFRIRQARARRASGRSILTDFQLLSGANAEQACARSIRAHPLKRIVRTVSVSGIGLFRTTGGAGIATARNATWITTDRCDGTLIDVRRGKVTVRPLHHKRSIAVRAGHRYLVRRPLFVPLKGRH